jgi:redox-sensitive bicupin YhaK (pirin superfamily)
MTNSALTTERLPTRDTLLGAGLPIRRALPNKARRMIGAWCFLDHAGPTTLHSHTEFRVGPHPHIGLQTFSWMIAGEILHRDSLGYEQVLRPGQVNLMTAGKGISHSEEALPLTEPMQLHLAQLWIALPDSKRHIDPAFKHYAELPVFDLGGFNATLLTGEFAGRVSPVHVHTPLLGIDLACADQADASLTLNPDFEYGALVLEGQVAVEGEALTSGTLLYLGKGRSELRVQASSQARVLLLGGEPLNEPVLLWWNFVARNEAEITQATNEWNNTDRFGEVKGYVGERLAAPSVEGLHLRR